MSELNLPACPICFAKDSLSRQTLEREGESFVWYECAECESVLLWLGDDRWAYQKVGREEKGHLQKRPLALDDLQALLPQAKEEDAVPAAPASTEMIELVSRQDRKGSNTRMLIPSLLALCLIGFLAFVVVGLFQAGIVPSLFATAAPAATPTPHLFLVGDRLLLGGANYVVVLRQIADGCAAGDSLEIERVGTKVTILNDPCYNSTEQEYYYQVSVASDGKIGWVRGHNLILESEYTPAPTRFVPTPDRRSDFEKCVESGQGVRYVISGTGVTRVSLTWENDTGGTNQGESGLPVCKTFTGFERGDFVYISAQIVRPTSGAGSITCRIYDGASVIAEAQAHGFASIATCSGVAR